MLLNVHSDSRRSMLLTRVGEPPRTRGGHVIETATRRMLLWIRIHVPRW
jgi:hypothetical protein